MKKSGLMAGLVSFVLVGLVAACSSEEDSGGLTAAKVDALCRDYCTCTDEANDDCLNECTSNLLYEPNHCYREANLRYVECMMDKDCVDPFEDCTLDMDPNLEDCLAEIMACNVACEEQDTWCEDSIESCYALCTLGTTCERQQSCLECASGDRGSKIYRVCMVTGRCEQDL